MDSHGKLPAHHGHPTIRVYIPDMIHNLLIVVIRILRVNRIAAGHKATLVIQVFGMLINVATGKTDLMPRAARCVLSDMVVVITITFEPPLTGGAFFPRVSSYRARASWAADICGIVIIVIEVIPRRTVRRRTVAAAAVVAQSC